MKLAIRRAAVLRAGIALLSFCVLAAVGLVIAVARTELPPRLYTRDSQVIEFRDHTVAHVFLSEDDKWRVAIDPDGPDEIDPAYLRALLCLEDRRFHSHHGVDPVAVARALFKNVARRRVVSGASTLTMQLARILSPRPRSLSAKLRQSVLALALEQRMSKRELLAAYLRFLPFGHNVEGVEAAALAYFGHRATALSAAEIATLLAVPQDPLHRFPSAANQNTLRIARDRIAERLLKCDALPRGEGAARVSPEEILRQVHATPVPDRLTPFPRQAMHAAMWLRQQYPRTARLFTTLDRGTQRNAERTLEASREDLARKGIHNAALVVTEKTAPGTATDVRALVGGFDYWDPRHGGQIASFAVPRSPGSALKPFLYAMAIDRGLALPDFLFPDVPLDYGSYAPQNFEKDHAVLVRLSDALSRSLNLPFVYLLNQFGVERFLGALRDLGVRSLRAEPGYYGLSAVVGGLEITPLELAGLYAALASDGHAQPLRLLASDPLPAPGSKKNAAVFSPEAAFLTRQALSRKDRPDFPDRQRFTGQTSGIHWKTGTSFGHRDAWAAGSRDTHTAVVWLGNLDSRPSSSLIGGPAAGPLLFDLLEAIKSPTPQSEGAPPPELQLITVCAYSGHPPGPACGETRQVPAPIRSVPTTHCPYHVSLEVDRKSGMAVTPMCRARFTTESRSFVVWPPQVRRFLDDKQRGQGAPPRYAPGCLSADNVPPPVITTPPVGQSILLVPGRPTHTQQVLLAADSQHSAHLSWFVDGEFLGTYSAQEPVFWTPSPGEHTIVVTDEAGSSTRRKLQVRSIK